MSRNGERPVEDYTPPPPAAALKPDKPNDKQRDIAKKMKSGAEKTLNGGKEYTAYCVDWYIYNNDIYCFRVRVDDGVIDVRGEYAGGMVENVKAKKVNDPAKESMELNWK